ncbi:MAG: rod shape-determining protein MreC [Acidimicrobiia bacterium]|nr:rod shape-determining protein MreC [Acidimicrobiia bacterium]
MLLTILLVASFLLMTFDVRSQNSGLTATLRTGAQSLTAPLQDASRAVVDPIVDFVDGLANLGSLREENRRLREELNQARLAAAEADSLTERVELLERLMNLPAGDFPQIVAEVRGGTGPLDLGLTINQGLEQGVVVGNPVVDENQVLIGVVTEALPNSAIIRLITDPLSGIQVLTQAGELGVVEGLGTADKLRLTIFDTPFDIGSGEVLRTSGTEAGIPAGLVVGQLTNDARTNGGGIETDDVAPLADGRTLSVVIVVQYGGAPIVTGTDNTTTTTTLPPDGGDTP